MSINACTLNKASIGSFCQPVRALVLARLKAELHPVLPPVTEVPRAPTYIQAGGRAVNARRPVFEPVLDFELPEVTVRVNILGMSGSQTITQEAQKEFVAVVNLTFD